MKTPLKDRKNFHLLKVLKGVVNAYFLTIILFLILALMLYCTKLSETVIPKAVIIISAISILLSGIKLTREIDDMGWLHGGLVGLLYMGILVVLSIMIMPSFSFRWGTVVDLFLGFIVGMFAGILGVNL